VRIGEEQGQAKLLHESGETELLDPAELPSPSDWEEGSATYDARTPAGRLIAVASAIGEGSTKRKWDPDTLQHAALESACDLLTRRLLAVDVLALGRPELLPSIELAASERDWLLAIAAARAGDALAALSALSRLPADRYRPKLLLAAGQLQAWRSASLDLTPLPVQVAPFLQSEPLARLIVRLSAPGGDDSAALTGDEIEVVTEAIDCSPLAAPLAAEMRAAIAAVTGRTPERPGQEDRLGANLRVLTALVTGRKGLIDSSEVDLIPLPILDDLIESGAVTDDAVLEGSAKNPHRTRYLKARLTPENLRDTEVDQLDHHEERVRRAFLYGDTKTLESLGDSDATRHYRTLLAIRAGKLSSVSPADVLPEARGLVEDLIQLAGVHSDGRPISEALTDRLVLDPTIWPVLTEIAGPTGLAPTPQLKDRYPAFCEWLALHQAREHLFLGNWERAIAAADFCLSLAEAETVRDEALNLKACGLHYLGQDGRAIGALEEAIQGVHSEALLANIGIVAVGLDPEVAGRHLGMLMDEAPTLALRMAAADRALTIWRNTDEGSWRNSDNSPLPDAFQGPLRRLVVAQLPLEDFRHLAYVLAMYDGAWLASAHSLTDSPHRDTLEARFYRARAADLPQMIKVMGEAMAAGSAPRWLLDERDSLRSSAIDILFDSLDEPDSTFGTVALAMVQHQVLESQEDTLLFTGLGVAGVTYHLSAHGEEVADSLVQQTHRMREGWQRLDGEARTRLEPVVELATRRVAINRVQAGERELDRAIDIFNTSLDLGGRAEPGSPAYSEALGRFRSVASICRSIRDEMLPWVTIVDREDVRGGLDKLIEATRDLEHRCLEILG
jgi:hypothetical protein